MPITIYKTGEFESAHLLPGHPKCGKLHGHSYKYEVWISSDELQQPYDFVLDFGKVKEYFLQFDHSDKVINDSCECMVLNAVEHFRELLKFEKDLEIKVRIWETSSSHSGNCPA
jgi:6-pyruvoyltetrahydropterin/6-carboxytetrahydropterin synthase